MLWCKAATWVRVKDAALRLLAKGFDGKPHQLPAQLLFGRFADFPRLEEVLEAQLAHVPVPVVFLTKQSVGLTGTNVSKAFQSPHGRLVAHAEAPSERRYVLIGDRLGSRPRPQLSLHHRVIRNVEERLRPAAW